MTQAGIHILGIAFPFQVGSQSVPLAASNEDLIKMSLVQIIMTQPGERYMQPDFGCGALNFIFEPDGEELEEYIKDTVTRSISQWEPRVTVNSVDVERNSMFGGQVIITVRYTVIATRQTQNVNVTLGSP